MSITHLNLDNIRSCKRKFFEFSAMTYFMIVASA
jgi:hypothetical protein